MLPWFQKNRDELVVGLILTAIEISSDLYFQNRAAVPPPPPPSAALEEVTPTIVQRPTPPEPPPPPPPPPPVPPPSPSLEPPPPGWARFTGKSFDVYVLSEEYRWRRGTTEVLNPEGMTTVLEDELAKLVRQYGGVYGDLIAIGTASCEGEDLEESRRAQDRADLVVIWTRRALVAAGEMRDRKLHTLSLGKYEKDCSHSDQIREDPRLTDEQRRVILIACKQRETPANLAGSLRELMEKESPFGIRPEDYKEFRLDRQEKLP